MDEIFQEETDKIHFFNDATKEKKKTHKHSAQHTSHSTSGHL